ncbi:MAG: hypothetical protein ACK53Y_02900, partial [bacterium]
RCAKCLRASSANPARSRCEAMMNSKEWWHTLTRGSTGRISGTKNLQEVMADLSSDQQEEGRSNSCPKSVLRRYHLIFFGACI